MIVYGRRDFVDHLLEPPELVSFERPLEELVIFEDVVVVAVIERGMCAHLEALQR